MSELVAFIPCRSGSKSIPDKNIKELGGKPLIAWSIKSAFDSGIERVFIDTDSEKYATIAREYGAEVLIRDPELAKDDTSMFQVLKNEIPRIDPLPEIVVLLQPTSPFRKTIQMKTAISFFLANPQYDSLISAEKIPEKYNPAQVIVKTITGIRMANGSPISQRLSRRQEFPEAWIPTGSIYIFKTSNLGKGNIYGENTMILETEPTININSQEDWDLVEKYLNEKR